MTAYYDYQKLTQALNFFAQQTREKRVNKLKVIKLLWAADRFHIRKYGRLIGGDDYLAMQHGPVSSTAKDIAEENPFLLEALLVYSRNYVQKDKEDGVQKDKEDGYSIRSMHIIDSSKLSKTDLEALEFAWKTFGAFGKYRLRDLTHSYPEWAKFQDVLTSGQSLREDIDPLDFFANPDLPDDPFALDQELLDESKEIFEANQRVEKALR